MKKIPKCDAACLRVSNNTPVKCNADQMSDSGGRSDRQNDTRPERHFWLVVRCEKSVKFLVGSGAGGT